MRRLRSIATAFLVVACGHGALANCYDTFGCSDRNRFRASDLAARPNCEFLYSMRNAIYAQHGYCFHTPRGIATFGNHDCRFNDVNLVPLNAIERANAATILQVEHRLGCAD